MAGGWTNDDGVNQQIQDSVNDEIARIRNSLPSGESLEFCEECGVEISEARRLALVGVRLCVVCQQERDESMEKVSLYNRKGSKDSQLR